MEFEEEVFWVNPIGVADVTVSTIEPDGNIHVETINKNPVTFDKLMEIYATKTRKAQCNVKRKQLWTLRFSQFLSPLMN